MIFDMPFNKEMHFKCISSNSTDSWPLTVSGYVFTNLNGFHLLTERELGRRLEKEM